jgi:MFS transporter, DHA1 family, inner membrane transport protein
VVNSFLPGAAVVALLVMAAITTLRAVSVGRAPLAVLANASGALVACLYVPVFGTAVYNQAKRSPCTLGFHIASEAGWDLGGASALLVAAGLLQAGVPIGTCILLSLVGAPASFYLLRTYFAALKRSEPCD